MTRLRAQDDICGRGRGRGRGRGHSQSSNQGTISANYGRSGVSNHGSFDDQELNANLPERFTKVKYPKSRQDFHGSSDYSHDGLDVKLNKDIRNYVFAQKELRSENDKEAWIDALEIPCSDEIHLGANTTVGLAPNKTHDPFKNVQRYLKTHYALLREDAVGPLRDAVDEFRNDPNMSDNANLSIYEKVHISGFTFTNMGIAARLKFSTIRAGRKILWSASKRLVAGSLIALTPKGDQFATKCIVAIVAARPLELLERSPPEVDVYFGSPEDIQIDPQMGFIMLESKSGYYESCRHTLRALQKLSRESFPLSPLVIGANPDVGPPQYLANWSNRSLVAAIEDGEHAPHFSSVDIVNNWPERPLSTTLDVSQWDALEHILTKKLAIIQGPPGTGKTFVSKVALQIMVQNRGPDDPPIIVAAQTNHALDQLLKHVSVFDPDFVRLGGRSTSADIKKRALYEIRQRERIPPIQGSLFAPARKRLEREHVKYGEILSIFDEKSDLISDDKLLQLKIISAAQQISLIDTAKDWVTTDEDSRTPMQHWLHKALIPFEVTYNDDNFGFEDVEEDLEFEQLRETEAEHGLTDEEDIELLRGPWKSITDAWTVATPSDHDLATAKHLLETEQDLWKIPEHRRGAVYHVMKAKAKALTLTAFRKEAIEYNKICEELKIGKWEKDAVFLKRANIIGMTTTGLSKYRPLIASLKPKIILIEEAAEVIESPVTAACIESVEHLILVGDHQQLKGHCSLRELEDEPYFFNVSMFERLVNLQMPFRTLWSQRRMNPEIRELVSSLYPKLKDHESVITRATLPPWGTGSVRSFFFHHDWLENKDESMSIYNQEEARMVAKFHRHLTRHGVPPAAITILTFYNGQRKRILRELKMDHETNTRYNLVKTVDSYQGEENEIIILSLVRNNDQNQIGFLGVDNRVCVALSRAKRGFYLFGNGYLLSAKSELWSNVGRLMSGSHPSRYGHELPLTCANHNRTSTVQSPDDFDKNFGGCDLWCATILDCGHKCQRMCHPMPHDLLDCHEPCGKELRCEHLCDRECHEVCYCDCDRFASGHNRQAQTSETQESQSTWSTHELPLSKFAAEADVFGGEFTTDRDMKEGARTSHAGRALARGGAAFQPLLTLPHVGARNELAGYLISDRTSLHAETATKPQNWTSFASGGFKEDDHNRAAAEEVSKQNRQTVDLLDLSTEEDGDDVPENDTIENMSDGRKRFTQSFRPLPLKGLGFSSTELAAADLSQAPGSGNVLNLMDQRVLP